MTTQVMKPSANPLTVKANQLKDLLARSKDEIKNALPKHLTPERMMRIALTEARKIPALLECDQASFLGSIVQCAQVGLEPGSALGHAYLIPFKNNQKGIKEVQLILGYRGLMDLAMRSGKVSKIIARSVYEGDTFSYAYGLDEKLEHVPGASRKPDAKLTHVYCVVTLKDGAKQFDVMTADDVEAIRKRSKAADTGPWKSDPDAMARKTVVRRLFKFTPVSIEIQHAVGLDEAGDRGEQDFGSIIDTTGHVVNDKAEQFKKALTDVETVPLESHDPNFDADVDPRIVK